jgi:hypothetical protein
VSRRRADARKRRDPYDATPDQTRGSVDLDEGGNWPRKRNRGKPSSSPSTVVRTDGNPRRVVQRVVGSEPTTSLGRVARRAVFSSQVVWSAVKTTNRRGCRRRGDLGDTSARNPERSSDRYVVSGLPQAGTIPTMGACVGRSVAMVSRFRWRAARVTDNVRTAKRRPKAAPSSRNPRARTSESPISAAMLTVPFLAERVGPC